MTDAGGNRVAGAAVAWTTTAGTVVASSTTDASGVATSALTSSTTAGTATVTATSGGASGTAAVAFTVGAAAKRGRVGVAGVDHGRWQQHQRPERDGDRCRWQPRGRAAVAWTTTAGTVVASSTTDASVWPPRR